MRKIINFLKKRIIFIIISICLLGSILLIILNLSFFETSQIKYRNDIRKSEIKKITDGLKKYILDKNNCPRTSNPVPQAFLPELIFDGSNNPRGGVSISSLEDLQNYIDEGKKDPSGSPYLIGTFDNKIYVYTNSFEVYKSSNQTYSDSLETSLCNQIAN